MINEPEWVTEGWHPEGGKGLAVKADAMVRFLTRSIARVRRAEFKATVGFARLETITTSGINCDIYQFHYYPEKRKGRLSVTCPDTELWDGRPVMGEFATGLVRAQVWPQLADTVAKQSVLCRLALARDCGYPLALPWSLRTSASTGDDRSAWTADVENDIGTFISERRSK